MNDKKHTLEMVLIVKESIRPCNDNEFNTLIEDIKPDSMEFVLDMVIKILKEE